MTKFDNTKPGLQIRWHIGYQELEIISITDALANKLKHVELQWQHKKNRKLFMFSYTDIDASRADNVLTIKYGRQISPKVKPKDYKVGDDKNSDGLIWDDEAWNDATWREDGSWKVYGECQIILNDSNEPIKLSIKLIGGGYNEKKFHEYKRGKDWQYYTEAEVEENEINKKNISETEKERLHNARIGQGKFRNDLLVHWSGKCAALGFSIEQILRASHIKPWKDSTDEERLDPFNGLLLSANLDALFDKYLISFSDDGKILTAISGKDKKALGLDSVQIKNLDERHKKYLQSHREIYYSRQ